MSYYPLGKLSNNFRRFCTKHIIDHLGDNTKIECGARLNDGVKIGDWVIIGENNLISSGVTIGDKVIIGARRANIHSKSQVG